MGKEVRLLADANRTFEIKVGDRTILPYELALAHWQEDRRDQNRFLLFCLRITDSSRRSREVRKGPKETLTTYSRVPKHIRRSGSLSWF